MPKRKRNEDAESIGESHDDRIRQKLRVAISNGVIRVATALKTARRFERQRLGKRQHDKIRGTDVNGRKINVEIAVLKGMDMKDLAKGKLYKNLAKTTSIAKTGMLPEDVKQYRSAGGVLDKTTADMMARLFKQKHVTEAVDAFMTGVRQVLGLGVNGTGAAKKLEPEKKNQILPMTDGSANEDSQAPAHTPIPVSISPPSGDHDSEEAEFLGFSSRVVSSSDGEDDDEASQAEEENEGIDRPRRLGDSISLSEGDSGDDDMVPDSDSEVSPGPDFTSKPKSKSKPSAPPPTNSAFLPTLSGGGYMSNSDSDATDVEEHVAPRKNRRGQRARQAIWEKKFKEEAKHVIDPKKNANARAQGRGKDKRGEGWDAQRGAMGPGDDRRNGKGGRGGRFGGSGRAGKGPSGGNAMPLGRERDKKKHKDDEGPLHPSWEARKMAKKLDGGIGGFAGKKMVFD